MTFKFVLGPRANVETREPADAAGPRRLEEPIPRPGVPCVGFLWPRAGWQSRRLPVPRTRGRAPEAETSLHGHQSLQAPLVRVGTAELLRVNSGRHLEREVLADLLHVK